MTKKYSEAVTKLDYMLSTIPKKYSNQLWLIRGVLNSQLGNNPQAKKDWKRAHKFDQENAEKFLEQKQNVYLPVFPQQQRLCSSYAFLKTPLASGGGNIYLRPSFSFPFIKPPNMIPCVDNSVLDSLNSSAIPLKPEAPWIKKCSFGIKFTDEIYITDDERENTPDEEKEYKKRKQKQQRSFEADIDMRSHSEPILQMNYFQDSKEEKNLEDPAELIRMFKEQYPDAEIDLEPEELDEQQILQI